MSYLDRYYDAVSVMQISIDSIMSGVRTSSSVRLLLFWSRLDDLWIPSTSSLRPSLNTPVNVPVSLSQRWSYSSPGCQGQK